jgi:hypothetical protein
VFLAHDSFSNDSTTREPGNLVPEIGCVKAPANTFLLLFLKVKPFGECHIVAPRLSVVQDFCIGCDSTPDEDNSAFGALA